MADDDSGGAFPCPSCGYLVFGQPPGSYDICDLCDWEDCSLSLRYPLDDVGGPNHDSLLRYQLWTLDEAGEPTHPRRPYLTPIGRDPGWRPIDVTVDSFPRWNERDFARPADDTELYWWRPTFWRRHLTPPRLRYPYSPDGAR